MGGTQQNWNLVWQGPFWQPHRPHDQPAPPGGFGIDSRIGAAAPRAPAASKENSCPQAILKFRPPSNLDYKAHHGPQTTNIFYWKSFGFIGWAPEATLNALLSSEDLLVTLNAYYPLKS